MRQGLYAIDQSITNKNIRKTYRIITMEVQSSLRNSNSSLRDLNRLL